MAGPRFFQRGHAQIAPGFAGREWRPGSRRRTWNLRAWGAALLGLLAAGGVAAYLFLANRAEGGATAPPATDTGSLLDNALAKVQAAVSDGSAPAPAVRGGLLRTPLSAPLQQQIGTTLGRGEARLIHIYQLIGQGDHRTALAEAESLVRDHPNFQLAQLVLGDLLSVHARPVRQLGDVPDTKAQLAAQQLSILREESRRRLLALTERPPEGSIPAQFLALSPQSRHAIAVDASRSRLYLFENTSPPASNGKPAQARLKLVADYYISVGTGGVEKQFEGDLRTPLGVYYITSTLNPKSLPDLYGVGALPLNYPNALDLQRGKTGSGIWLHGTPSEQYARAPLASEGCVVVSNADFTHILSTVQIRTTPVVIASELQWVRPDALDTDRTQFESALEAWRQTKSRGQIEQLKTFYSERFQSQGRDLAQWWPRVEKEVQATGSRELSLRDISLLRWRDSDDTMVVTFGEVPAGQGRGITRRQYWSHENGQWKIFYEGNI